MENGPHFNSIGGFKVLLDETSSTQWYAGELLKSSQTRHGTLVVARTQHQGRGRHDKQWLSAQGENLTLSIILIHPDAPNDVSIAELSMAAAIAVRDSISQLVKVPVYIKWPNDILCNAQKIAGILINNQWRGKKVESSIVGIGINVNQTNFGPDLIKAGSLRHQLGYELELSVVLEVLMIHLNKVYAKVLEGDHQYILKTYQDFLFGRNEYVTAQFQGSPINHKIKVIGVDGDGKLLVESESHGLKTYDMDEIRIIF